MNRVIFMSIAAACFALVAVLVPGRAACAPISWDVADGGNGHLYEAVEESLTWEEANAAAEARGWYLATITSASENEFVLSMLLTKTGDPNPVYWSFGSNRYFGPWIGGKQVEGAPASDEGWYWVTGEPFSYTAWYPGEPNDYDGDERYLHFYSNLDIDPDPGWNDYNNDWYYDTYSYVIETEPIPEPSSLILATCGLLGLVVLLRRQKQKYSI